jgi:zinc D-Ala-D-Ala carboxypeptidase
MHSVPLHSKFKESDFACKCGTGCGKGYKDMDGLFLTKLFALRDTVGLPITITSAYRCAKHPESIKRPSSAHTTGHAVDFKVADSSTAFAFMQGALAVGIVRVGWNQQHNFFHIDAAPHLPQKVLFKY